MGKEFEFAAASILKGITGGILRGLKDRDARKAEEAKLAQEQDIQDDKMEIERGKLAIARKKLGLEREKTDVSKGYLKVQQTATSRKYGKGGVQVDDYLKLAQQFGGRYEDLVGRATTLRTKIADLRDRVEFMEDGPDKEATVASIAEAEEEMKQIKGQQAETIRVQNELIKKTGLVSSEAPKPGEKLSKKGFEDLEKLIDDFEKATTQTEGVKIYQQIATRFPTGGNEEFNQRIMAALARAKLLPEDVIDPGAEPDKGAIEKHRKVIELKSLYMATGLSNEEAEAAAIADLQGQE